MNLLDELMALETSSSNTTTTEYAPELTGAHDGLVVNVKFSKMRSVNGNMVSTATILDGEHQGKTLPYWLDLTHQSEKKRKLKLGVFKKLDTLNGNGIITMLKQGREIDEQSVMEVMGNYKASIKVNYYNGKNTVGFVQGQAQVVEDPLGNDPY